MNNPSSTDFYNEQAKNQPLANSAQLEENNYNETPF
jgi:hypothetical protein